MYPLGEMTVCVDVSDITEKKEIKGGTEENEYCYLRKKVEVVPDNYGK